MRKPLLIAALLGVIAFIFIVVLLLFPPENGNTPTVAREEKLTEEEFIDKNLKELSLEEKVRQMLIWTITGPEVSEETMKSIEKLQPGGIMIGGTMTHTDLLRLTVQLRALKTKVPLIIAIDQEGGDVRRLSEDPLEKGSVQGAASDKLFCENIQHSSRWLNELGVNLNFGIIADIAWTPESYMYERAYGSDPGTVSRYVSEAVECTIGVKTTVKHFPGHGRASEDSHYVLASIPLSYEEWIKTDAVPFKAAIQSDVDAIMLGHLIYPDIASEPATLSPRFVQELRKFGFKGIIVTDDLGMLEASGLPPEETLRKAIIAGNDMLLYADTSMEAEEVVRQSLLHIQNKDISEEELNTRVKRILRLKYSL